MKLKTRVSIGNQPCGTCNWFPEIGEYACLVDKAGDEVTVLRVDVPAGENKVRFANPDGGMTYSGSRKSFEKRIKDGTLTPIEGEFTFTVSQNK